MTLAVYGVALAQSEYPANVTESPDEWDAVHAARRWTVVESTIHCSRSKGTSVNGVLGTRGSLTIDLVFLAMIAVVPILWGSIWLAHKRRRFSQHKWIQIGLATVLLFAVIAFEVEMRFEGWTHLAKPSPFWRDGAFNDWIDYSLVLHLVFAIPTPIVWAIVIYRALRQFPNPAEPSLHSRSHRRWGKLSAIGMTITAITGWAFYYLAFAAT